MSKIKAKDFVQIWLEACEKRESISWIANTIGVSDGRVHALAANLRKSGVELPPIRRPFVEPVDVSQLNNMISEQWTNYAPTKLHN